MRLENKIAIVSGAAGGIGSAICRRFVAEGATVVGLDIDADLGKPVFEQLAASGHAGYFVEGDVTSKDQVTNWVSEVEKRFGHIDVAVSNAGGIRGVYFDVVNTEEEDWDRTQDLNLKAPYLIGRAVLPGMLDRSSGSIVNVGSAAGLGGPQKQSAYAAAKAGTINLTRAMAMDYAGSGVRVNCVCPGLTDTPPIQRMFNFYGDPKEIEKRFISNIPLGRMGRPEELANVILFIASDEASYMTGAVIPVDGGWTAR